MLSDLLSDPVVLRICLTAFVIGTLAGLSGVFVVLQKQSLLGDVIAHSTLPGVCVAWWITQRHSNAVLTTGAFFAGVTAYVFLRLLSSRLQVKSDAALSATLSIFFGFGILLLSHVQRLPNAGTAGIESFIFGNLSTVTHSDLLVSVALLGAFIVFVTIVWRKLAIVHFDPHLAWTRFGSLHLTKIGLGTFVVLIIGCGLQTMGALLITSILIAPAVAARLWSRGFLTLLILSGTLGGLSCFLGSMWSAASQGVPPGPASTLVALAFVLISLGVRKWWESTGKFSSLRV
jgi:manganese/zinc/iron transport system permease protein